jgi:hypothetical protein
MGEVCLAKEHHVQYRNPKQSSSQLSHFDQAFSRALKRVGIQPQTDPDPDPAPGAAGDDAPFQPEDPDEETTEPLLVNGAQLLSAVREPIEWLLDLARRLAGDDPVDAAAVARVHAAFCARLQGQPAHVRPSDLFIVLGLLLSALDPRVAARVVADTVGGGAAAILDAEPAVEGGVTETARPPAEQPPRRSRFLRWFRPRNTRQGS